MEYHPHQSIPHMSGLKRGGTCCNQLHSRGGDGLRITSVASGSGIRRMLVNFGECVLYELRTSTNYLHSGTFSECVEILSGR